MFRKCGKIGLNGLMVVLLLGLLVLPISSMGIAGVKTISSSSEVMSAQDTIQNQNECVCPVCPQITIDPEMERLLYEQHLLGEQERIVRENVSTELQEDSSILE